MMYLQAFGAMLVLLVMLLAVTPINNWFLKIELKRYIKHAVIVWSVLTVAFFVYIILRDK